MSRSATASSFVTSRSSLPSYEMPLRVGHSPPWRLNVFSIDSFMDKAGAEAVEFRLRHLQDARARDLVSPAAERFGWSKGDKPRDVIASLWRDNQIKGAIVQSSSWTLHKALTFDNARAHHRQELATYSIFRFSLPSPTLSRSYLLDQPVKALLGTGDTGQ
jgi:nicotinate dehydrogenase subunit B